MGPNNLQEEVTQINAHHLEISGPEQASHLLVKGYTLPFRQNPRHGRVVELPPIARGCPAVVQQAYEASLRVKGAKLFNLLPAELRNMDGVMVETFKSRLDAWLGTVPDQPTVPGRQRGAATNSLLDQVLQLN